MGAFQSGFQMGGSLANQAIRNAMEERELAIREEAARRAKEEFAWRQAQQQRENDAFSNYTNLAGGISRDTQGQIGQTYGMNPQQIANAMQSGGVDGLRARMAGYDRPDSFDLQNAPAAGVRPRFTPDQLQVVQPSRMDRERGLEQLAIARRDVQGIRASQDAQRLIQKDDIASGVMKMPLADLEKNAPDITTSGYPLLYTGKDKNGYTFLKTEADGKTPIPGSTIKLNESQLRQMALAHELGKAGFGTEALATLTAANKDLGEHVSKWNDTISKAATASNTALHYGNQDQTARITANAAAQNAQTNSDLRNEQIKGLRTLRENRDEAIKLMEDFDRLTPEQQAGPEGQALIQRFNTINVKAGGTVGLQPKAGTGQRGNILKMPVEQKKNDDGTYTAFAKDGGQALYNTINGEAIPLGMGADEYAAMKKVAQQSGVKLVAGEESGRLVLRFQGADGQFYTDPQKARYAKPAPEPKATTPADKPAAPDAGIKVRAGAGNPYNISGRGGIRVDRQALQADLAEYNSLKDDTRPLVQGRVKLLEQKLRAAGALE